MTELEAKEKRIEELTEWLKEASDGKLKLQMLRADLVSKIGNQKKRIAELEAQIEKIKLQYDYAFNQLCKSREILCSMLSQYRDRKEINYSTRECGEKLLKEGVFKND